MLNILIIKLSSLGDVVHLFPAVHDLKKNVNNVRVNWLVEPSYSELVSLSSAVDNVITISTRQFKKKPFNLILWIKFFKKLFFLRKQNFDMVIDAQGLIKSAMIARFISKNNTMGFDLKVIRDKHAAKFYSKLVSIGNYSTAIDKNRKLFSNIFQYSILDQCQEYGLSKYKISGFELPNPFVIFFYGTTWGSKSWPETYWINLAKKLEFYGYNVVIGSGNTKEYQFAEKMQNTCKNVFHLNKLSIKDWGYVLQQSKAVVSVDTGLGHLANAYDKICIGLFGATSEDYVGMIGSNGLNIQSNWVCSPCYLKKCKYISSVTKDSPCMLSIKPDQVLQILKQNLGF